MLKKSSPNTYLTKDNLIMILLSKKEFISIANQYGLKIKSNPIKYKSIVSTGKRSVLRGFLIKESATD